MIGTIERIKNSVLLKCSTLNDEIISKTLNEIIDTRIYRFCEEMISMIGNVGDFTEEKLRESVKNEIKTPIIKKIKRKLFIDSLALQITNDTFIEDNINGKITLDKIKNTYIKELENNKSSNQLNMTEDLNLDEIINNLRLYVDRNIVSLISENKFLSGSVVSLVDNLKKNLEDDLKKMIDDADLKYENILISELNEESKEEKGDDVMLESLALENDALNNISEENEAKEVNKFEKYDDMTLFNKMILSLNTEEEKLSRLESKLEQNKKEVDEKLAATNKNIEANIERENTLSQRKVQLENKELELNSKLSETEVIFLNMKPLIKGLNKIKDSNEGGNTNE
ncbi:MAG TPA: hypothetical protein IAB68_05215 [Candidatus Aphodocola excrementigallinarum]|uniref:Uncharacterized protein n=1 Tax=Candidatus Aphodocola excrementigallinarum TaxID=2840670 RepID=A0A9D1IQ37_9FIRM|nr:hypothetical protein [Candidatus Aphodocola excrementigallinarum]